MSATERTRQALDRAMAAALRDSDHAFEPVEIDGFVLDHDGTRLEDTDTPGVDAIPLAHDDGTEAAA